MSLRERTEEFAWYHTLELPGGVTTPGQFDMRRAAGRVPLPRDLTGKRCLDVGTADGFWAFELERRGASEVVAIDLPHADWIDWPGNTPRQVIEDAATGPDIRRQTFELAREALGHRAEWRPVSVYELSEDMLGTFDFVFAGSLLLHLRDPALALTAIRRVLRGDFLSVDTISLALTAQHPRQPVARLEAPGWALWWQVNLAGYRKLFDSAGYDRIDQGGIFFLRPGAGYRPSSRASGRGALSRVVERVAPSRLGIPHSWAHLRSYAPAALDEIRAAQALAEH